MTYVDVERLLVGHLKTVLTPTRVGTDTPANLATALPFVQVTRFGGSDDVPSIDRATVDIDCYAATRSAASALAEQIRSTLRFATVGLILDGALVVAVSTIVGPAWRPYENTGVRRHGASYELIIQSRMEGIPT